MNIKKFRLVSIFFVIFFFAILTFGQTIFSGPFGVSIIPTGLLPPAPSSILEISSSNKGMLIPRVALLSTNNGTLPIASPALSLLVYNTANSGPLGFNVTPGFYFWNGSIWERLNTGSASNDWSIFGNAGTNGGINFIGTTDPQPFNIRVNNQKAGRIDWTSPFNTFFGYQSGISTINPQNTAFGYQAYFSNKLGRLNTAIGYRALYSNTTSNLNVSIGSFALYSQSYSNGGFEWNSFNTAVGVQSLNDNNSTSVKNGINNTALGYQSLVHNTQGYNNTATGVSSLRNNTVGFSNTSNGMYALSNNTVGNNNTALGYAANVSSNNLINATAIGNGAIVNISDKVRIGNSTLQILETHFWSVTSDSRFKYNIKEGDVKGLEFIKRLRPVVYNFDTRKFEEFLTQNMPDSIKQKYFEGVDFKPSSAIRQSGFIGQEVEQAAKSVGYDFSGVHHPNNENDNYSISYSQFVVPLVKAMQEQQKVIEDLQRRIERLEKN